MALTHKRKVPRKRNVSALTTAALLLLMLVLVIGLRAGNDSQFRSNVTGPSRDLQTNRDRSAVVGSTKIRNWIWDELSQREQEQALHDVMPYLVDFIGILNRTEQDRWVSQNKCQVDLFGSQWGAHQLCIDQRPLKDDCNFISFGISRDYSFDTDLATKWNCRGFAADPTIVHKSSLHPLVTFHNIAAKTLTTNKEAKKAAKDNAAPWWIASIPSVKEFLGLERISVLKMDCEGCEYSLARDILKEDPNFFATVQQFTFEVHLNRIWLKDTQHLYYFAMLFKLLKESGLRVMGTSIGGCGQDEKVRSIPEIYKLSYPGASKQRPRERRSCHEYLFAR